MEISPGTLIHDRYCLQHRLGRGSFGEVWSAHDEVADVDVALKIYVALDDKGIEEFRSEFRNVINLVHTNILRPEYYDVSDSRPFLVMPLCRGSVETQSGSMSESELWRFIRDVSSGLGYLHSHDILHRDIKPANILINADGDYVISDFGISTRMRSTMRRSSMRQDKGMDTSGTIAYMAPELFTKSPSAVKATDIWALGATLYELITGELLFFGQGGVVQLKGAELPDLPEIYSKDLRDTVASCLSMDTWSRPTASKLTEYAESMLKGEGFPPSRSSKTKWIWLTLLLLLIISGSFVGYIIIVSKQGDPNAVDEFLSEDVSGLTSYAGDDNDKVGKESSSTEAEMDLQRQKDSLAKVEREQHAREERLQRQQDSLEAVRLAAKRVEEQRIAEERAQREAAEKASKQHKQDSLKRVEEQQKKMEQARTEAEEKAMQAARTTTGMHNGHEWVDLGLSVLWATCNVGASSPSDYGNYYAWGETKTKSNYTKGNSLTYEDTSLSDISGNIKYDVAMNDWGAGWRMPTKGELQELIEKCELIWTIESDYSGCKVIGPNGKSIFFLAVGFRLGRSIRDYGEVGIYWSSTPGAIDGRAYTFDFDYLGINLVSQGGVRHYGICVRPVLDKASINK